MEMGRRVRSARRETRPTFLPRSSSAWEVKVKEQKEKYSVEKLMVKKIEAVEKKTWVFSQFVFSSFLCSLVSLECNFFALWRTTLTKMEIEREI